MYCPGIPLWLDRLCCWKMRSRWGSFDLSHVSLVLESWLDFLKKNNVVLCGIYKKHQGNDLRGKDLGSLVFVSAVFGLKNLKSDNMFFFLPLRPWKASMQTRPLVLFVGLCVLVVVLCSTKFLLVFRLVSFKKNSYIHDASVVQKSRCQGKLEQLKMDFLLLMAEILHQLIGSLSHYLQGFLHPRWLFGISSINSTATYREGFLLVQCIWDCYCLLAGPAGVSQFHGTWIRRCFHSGIHF